MNNLAALGVGQLLPVAVLGDDGQAYDLVKELKRLPVDDRLSCIAIPARLTPTYTKPMRRRLGPVARAQPARPAQPCFAIAGDREKVIDSTTAAFEACDGLIVVDQVNEENWGVVTTAVREHLAELGRRTPGKLIFVDSRA